MKSGPRKSGTGRAKESLSPSRRPAPAAAIKVGATVWTTRYAIAQGVKKQRVRLLMGGDFVVLHGDWRAHKLGVDCFTDEAGAVARANEMLETRLKMTRNELARLEKLTFKVAA